MHQSPGLLPESLPVQKIPGIGFASTQRCQVRAVGPSRGWRLQMFLFADRSYSVTVSILHLLAHRGFSLSRPEMCATGEWFDENRRCRRIVNCIEGHTDHFSLELFQVIHGGGHDRF